MAVDYAINKKSARDLALTRLLHSLCLFCAVNDITLAARHLPSVKNTSADSFWEVCSDKNNYWCVVSTVGRENGTVNVYDSLYSIVSTNSVYFIAGMISSLASRLVVRVMDVEKQSNGAGCGILAIANVQDICSGFNLCLVRFDHRVIR